MDNSHVRERLLKKYGATATGTWRILGEDSNCDLGGAHYQPELETVTGTYSKVVEYALSLSRFFTWGGGGDIIKLPSVIKNVDFFVSPRVAKLESEREEIRARLAEIEKELKGLIP